MKEFTIRDLFDYSKSQDTGIFGNTDAFTFMEQYNSEKKLVSRFFKNIYEDKYLKEKFETIEKAYENFCEEVQTLLYSKKGNYEKIYEAYLERYSPIENYDRYENHTLTNKGIVSKQNGVVTTSENFNRSEKTYEVPNDSEEEKEIGKTETTGNSNENGTTQNFNDLKNETDTTNTFESHVHGNIGVTESTTMVKNFSDFWRDFSFLKIFFDDIVSVTCESGWRCRIE